MASRRPVGELKKLVSLVDRTDFDEFVYPKDSAKTVFQAVVKPYHNYVKETATYPFLGDPRWGQRITFSVPWPWQADFLHSITLRLKPQSWLTQAQQQHLGPAIGDWVPLAPASQWIWANSLGTVAIERAEMEVDGVILEQFSGDWSSVWNRIGRDASAGTPWEELACSYADPGTARFLPSEDGYVYCPLPFWFSKAANAAFPLLSCGGPDRVRFHITLRPFADVVRKLTDPKACAETPLGQSFQARDYSFPFRKIQQIDIPLAQPAFEVADVLCELSHIDGDLRTAYIDRPHELLMSPVVETQFGEPLKYTVNTPSAGTIKIGLPLTMANGPLRHLVFFLRRNAAAQQYAEYDNYSATLPGEADPVWSPERPLLTHAQLLVGTAVWADEDEAWWRLASGVEVPGGVRAAGNYVYAYNFADHPTAFAPSGSVNASRVDLRLNLTVAPPGGAADGEWTVSVFLVGTNWIRFENGLANQIFMD